ncbi:MAG: adenine nucleotide alpha hydrolase family protein [Clostridia bacterium]|nr:adenine nucleotide alpha hydrolase family protein [Clostridia bacterium]
MEFKSIRRVLSCTRRAVDRFGMINDGDKIAVGLSGGKDSVALLAALHDLKRFYPADFSICAITVSMGFEDFDASPLKTLCDELDIEFRLVETRLAELIFDERKESNPCALCARMRRGILHDNAKEMGCNKLALGHHYDDVIDTFMLNLFNEGRLSTFLPVTYLSRKDITVIRPFVYLPEKDIKYFMSKNELPVIKSPCPEDKRTDRETLHMLVGNLDKERRGLKHRIFNAIEEGGLLDKESE